MLIGNKETFAVEFIQERHNPKMGYGKLWIQNVFLGTKEDLIFLNGYLIGLLNEIIASKQIHLNLENKNKDEIFELLKSTNKLRSDYFISGSTFTDDFEIYSFEKKEKIFLLWKLRNDNNNIFSDLKEYSQEIHFVHLYKQEIEAVREKVLKEII
jgi:hypothetical protein